MQETKRPGARMSAGDFLWYVARVVLVISAFLFVIALVTQGRTQGLMDEQDEYAETQEAQTHSGTAKCSAFQAAVNRAQEMLTALDARGIKTERGTIDASQVQPIIKAITADGTEIPEADAIDTMFYVAFPDEKVAVMLGAGGCTKGQLVMPVETWNTIKSLVAGEPT